MGLHYSTKNTLNGLMDILTSNTDIIIKSIPLVLKKIKNIKYIIPVGTFGGDKDYLKKINKLINNLDLRGYVELPQSLEVEDMPAFHNLADIAISIPSSDSFPSFLHEAMACKVASIVSDLPAVTEFLKNKITIEVNILDDFKIESIENEFKHVILNIINNSKDAFNENSTKDRKIIIFTQKNDSSRKLMIQDNAGGIPEYIISTIFNANVTSKTDGKGTGIGLYMTKQIIEKYSGSINVKNANEGALFTIKF